MTPRDIIAKHLTTVRGIRMPDVQRAIDGAMRELAEYDYVIIERRDLLKSAGSQQACRCNQSMQKTDR